MALYSFYTSERKTISCWIRRTFLRRTQYLKKHDNIDNTMNLSSIIKIAFRPLKNSKIQYKVTKMYRDTLRLLYEVDYLRCYFVVLFISGILSALSKSSFFF